MMQKQMCPVNFHNESMGGALATNVNYGNEDWTGLLLVSTLDHWNEPNHLVIPLPTQYQHQVANAKTIPFSSTRSGKSVMRHN